MTSPSNSRAGGTILAVYMTPFELASELGIGVRTLDRWRRLREAPAATLLGRKVYFHRDAVRKWLASREGKDPISRV